MRLTFTDDANQINAALCNITHTVVGTISATDQIRIFATPTATLMPEGAVAKIDDVLLFTETGDAIDATNYWSWQVVDITNSNDLLATAVSNFTGGTAITADVGYRITPDQNNELGADTVLELVATKAASATTQEVCSVVVYWHWEV